MNVSRLATLLGKLLVVLCLIQPCSVFGATGDIHEINISIDFVVAGQNQADDGVWGHIFPVDLSKLIARCDYGLGKLIFAEETTQFNMTINTLVSAQALDKMVTITYKEETIVVVPQFGITVDYCKLEAIEI